MNYTRVHVCMYARGIYYMEYDTPGVIRGAKRPAPVADRALPSNLEHVVRVPSQLSSVHCLLGTKKFEVFFNFFAF